MHTTQNDGFVERDINIAGDKAIRFTYDTAFRAGTVPSCSSSAFRPYLETNQCVAMPVDTSTWGAAACCINGAPDPHRLLALLGPSTPVPVVRWRSTTTTTTGTSTSTAPGTPVPEHQIMTLQAFADQFERVDHQYHDDHQDHSQDHLPVSSWYLKDWHGAGLFPSILGDYPVPIPFTDDWMNDYLRHRYGATDATRDYRFVYLGPRGTRTGLHADVLRSYSWSVNLAGRKRWRLLHPSLSRLVQDRSDLPATHATRCSRGQWLRDLMQTVSEDVYRAGVPLTREAFQRHRYLHRRSPSANKSSEIQRAPACCCHGGGDGDIVHHYKDSNGDDDDPNEDDLALEAAAQFAITYDQPAHEALFVPSGWFHTVENLAPTLSINHNWVNGYNLGRVVNYLRQEMDEASNLISHLRSASGEAGFMSHGEWAATMQRNVAVNSGFHVYSLTEMVLFMVGRATRALMRGTERVEGAWGDVQERVSALLRVARRRGDVVMRAGEWGWTWPWDQEQDAGDDGDDDIDDLDLGLEADVYVDLDGKKEAGDDKRDRDDADVISSSATTKVTMTTSLTVDHARVILRQAVGPLSDLFPYWTPADPRASTLVAHLRRLMIIHENGG